MLPEVKSPPHLYPASPQGANEAEDERPGAQASDSSSLELGRLGFDFPGWITLASHMSLLSFSFASETTLHRSHCTWSQHPAHSRCSLLSSQKGRVRTGPMYSWGGLTISTTKNRKKTLSPKWYILDIALHFAVFQWMTNHVNIDSSFFFLFTYLKVYHSVFCFVCLFYSLLASARAILSPPQKNLIAISNHFPFLPPTIPSTTYFVSLDLPILDIS